VASQAKQQMGSRTGLRQDGQAVMPNKGSSVPTAPVPSQCLWRSGREVDRPTFVTV